MGHDCETPLPTSAVGTTWTCPDCGDAWRLERDPLLEAMIGWVRVGQRAS